MRATLAWLATLSLGFPALGQQIALTYSAASIVNAASNQVGPLAPATFVSIYGTELSNVTRAILAEDIRDGVLPTALTGTGLRVLVNNLPANVYYVSPSQINFLVPSTLGPGKTTVQVIVDGHGGPIVPVTLKAASPALFQMDASTAIAVHADSSLLTAASPAVAGEVVVLYATGLGYTSPLTQYSQIAYRAAPLDDPGFRVLLDGIEVAPSRILYAGVAPGFAGLFQVNVKLPDSLAANPEVRLLASGETSPPGIHIFAKSSQPDASAARSSK